MLPGNAGTYKGQTRVLCVTLGIAWGSMSQHGQHGAAKDCMAARYDRANVWGSCAAEASTGFRSMAGMDNPHNTKVWGVRSPHEPMVT